MEVATNPLADPHFRGCEGVYGVILNDNEDAKYLTQATMDAKVLIDGKVVRAGDDATGAMHQATISHILWIRHHGWDKYVEESKRRAKMRS